MTEEEKELLLKDLCSRLPYELIVRATYKDGDGWKTEDRKLLGVYSDGQVYLDSVYTEIEKIKPYLRLLSSMTEEEINEFHKLRFIHVDYGLEPLQCVLSVNEIDWLNAHHFDYRGLIEKGFALEALEEMYNN